MSKRSEPKLGKAEREETPSASKSIKITRGNHTAGSAKTPLGASSIDLERTIGDHIDVEQFFDQTQFTSNHRDPSPKGTETKDDELDWVKSVQNPQDERSLRDGEEIVFPMDKHGNSIHRYFVKGHWIVHSSSQKVIKWCPPDPSCTKFEPPPVQQRDEHGALLNRACHLAWLQRHTETHYFKQRSEVPHPLACVRDWLKEHPNTLLVKERTNSDGENLPGYIYNPWRPRHAP
jgi:hypothetical protein